MFIKNEIMEGSKKHIRHKWSKTNRGNYVCDKCDLLKFRTSERLLMAITTDGKNHYKYIQHWGYIPLNCDMTYKLPACK